ncbi:MAG TPA: adenylyl-sulfate kinase [Trinickia sp.]|jgi:adenylylsulfate kinase|nr:adenylyl-sulfate kinase [Trinickia sp.]
MVNPLRSDPRASNCDGASSNVFWQSGGLASDVRARQFGYAPATLWLTGLSGAGKSTIAYALEQRLRADRRPCAVLDGDNVRHRLSRDLGFSDDDRRENVRRVAEVARLMNDVGLIVITALVSPFREDRAAARRIIGEDRFVEVYVSTSLEVCESRDPKGLYRKARQGELRQFTGVSSPYEPPRAPTVVVDTAQRSLEDGTDLLYDFLSARWGGSADAGTR